VPGGDLLCTVALEDRVYGRLVEGEERPLSALSLRCALGVGSFLEHEIGLSYAVKWPNDLLVGGHKIAGILIERSLGEKSSTRIGIGLNLSEGARPAGSISLARALQAAPSSAAARFGDSPRLEPEMLLGPLLSHVESGLKRSDWREAVEARLAGYGTRVRLEGGEGVAGRIVGISPDGELRVEDSRGEEICIRDVESVTFSA
jgi:BirA family biotin operon repressor/biotin-[acetyl-CoA-carboxylase] ligase